MTPEELRAARKSLGHTLHSMAAAMGMGKNGWQSVQHWETGKHAIPGPVVTLVKEWLAKDAKP